MPRGNLVKGVKNIFGRKARKAKKARRAHDNLHDDLDSGLHDDLWKVNPLAKQPVSNARVNPLYEPEPSNTPPTVVPPVQQAPVVPSIADNDHAAVARQKRDTTGKGLGKMRLKDRHVGEDKSGNSDDVSASAHEVKRINYNREIGDSGTNEGFFKPEEAGFHGSFAANDTGVGRVEQQDVNGLIEDVAMEDNLLIGRSVANTRLDQALGLNTVAHEFEAKHQGQRGVVSAKTEGVAAQDADDIDYSSPEAQRSLSNIQVFDYLTNQQDRHDGNIFMNPETGTATGIDNDLSFGHTQIRANDRNHGLPSQVDPEMAKRILAMSEEELSSIVGGKKGDYQRLGPLEQQAAVQRLQTLKAHVSEEDDNGGRKNVVDEWNDDTFNKSLQESDGMKSTNESYDTMGFAAKSLTARLHYRQLRRNKPELWQE